MYVLMTHALLACLAALLIGGVAGYGLALLVAEERAWRDVAIGGAARRREWEQ